MGIVVFRQLDMTEGYEGDEKFEGEQNYRPKGWGFGRFYCVSAGHLPLLNIVEIVHITTKSTRKVGKKLDAR